MYYFNWLVRDLITSSLQLPLGTSHVSIAYPKAFQYAHVESQIPAERLVLDPPQDADQTSNIPMRLRYGAWLAEEANGWLASDSSGDSRSAATESSERDSAPSASTTSSVFLDDRDSTMLDNALVVVADDNADLRQCVATTCRHVH